MDSRLEQSPAYLTPTNIALVFLGGTCGVLARELLMIALPDRGGVPVAVLIANVSGALLFGLLLEALARTGAGAQCEKKYVRVRLLLGTGLLGGFTTYSALAHAVTFMWRDDAVWLAIIYGVGTVLLGALAAWCGMVIGAAFNAARGGSGELRGVDE